MREPGSTLQLKDGVGESSFFDPTLKVKEKCTVRNPFNLWLTVSSIIAYLWPFCAPILMDSLVARRDRSEWSAEVSGGDWWFDDLREPQCYSAILLHLFFLDLTGLLRKVSWSRRRPRWLKRFRRRLVPQCRSVPVSFSVHSVLSLIRWLQALGIDKKDEKKKKEEEQKKKDEKKQEEEARQCS